MECDKVLIIKLCYGIVSEPQKNVCYKMKKGKKLVQYASTENMSRGPDIADIMLRRFSNGDLSKLKKFFFNAAIDVREIEEQAPFDKEIKSVPDVGRTA